MSRIGKQSVVIPEKIEVVIEDNAVHVKGPQGELSRTLHPQVRVSVENNEVTVEPVSQSKLARSLWGTYTSLIKSMVRGVQEPFSKKLVVEGVGYRVSLSGNTLELSVGYSHPVTLEVPENIKAVVEKNEITISGPNKELVGQFAAEIRAVKKPEPYKGKGIRYEDEIVRRKQGKRATT